MCTCWFGSAGPMRRHSWTSSASFISGGWPSPSGSPPGRDAGFGSRNATRGTREPPRGCRLNGRVCGRFRAKLSTELVRGHDVIGIEKLSLHRMTRRAKGAGAAQKRGLNRSLQHAALGRLGTCIAYKANLAQVSFIEVPAAFTSQRCHQCGHTGKGNRESQAVFRCRRCAWTGNADTNAAINIREEALARWAAHTEQLAGTSGEKPGGITPVSQAGSKSKTDPHTGPASGPAVSAMNRKPPNAA